MNYHLANKNDLPKIVSFFELVDNDFVPTLSEREINIEKKIKSLYKHGEKFLLLQKMKRIIGVISFSENQSGKGNAHISYFAIHPSYREKFLGRNLLCECLNILIGDKEAWVQVETWSDNKKALELYNKEGFEVKKVLKSDRGKNLDTIILEEPLEDIHILRKEKNENSSKI